MQNETQNEMNDNELNELKNDKILKAHYDVIRKMEKDAHRNVMKVAYKHFASCPDEHRTLFKTNNKDIKSNDAFLPRRVPGAER